MSSFLIAYRSSFLHHTGEFLTQVIHQLAILTLSANRLCREDLVLGEFERLFFFFDSIGIEEFGIFLSKANEGVSRNELGLQVRQWANAEVVGRVVIRALINDKRDKESQLAYLDGNGLNIYSIDAMLYEVELTGVVGTVNVFVKAALDVGKEFLTLLFAIGLECLGCLTHSQVHHHLLPLHILRVDATENVHHLLEHTHGKCARTAGRVEDAALIERLHDGLTQFW